MEGYSMEPILMLTKLFVIIFSLPYSEFTHVIYYYFVCFVFTPVSVCRYPLEKYKAVFSFSLEMADTVQLCIANYIDSYPLVEGISWWSDWQYDSMLYKCFLVWYDDGRYWGHTMKCPTVWTLPWKGQKESWWSWNEWRFFCVGISAFSCLVCETALHFFRLSKAHKEELELHRCCLSTIINLWFGFVFLLLLFYHFASWLHVVFFKCSHFGIACFKLFSFGVRLFIKDGWDCVLWSPREEVFLDWCVGCRNYLL